MTDSYGSPATITPIGRLQDVPAAFDAPKGRPLLATVLCVLATAAFIHASDHASVLVLPAAMLLAAAGLLWRTDLTSQIFVRSVLWSNLLLGTLLGVASSASEATLGGAVALTTGAALLTLGNDSLRNDSGRFTPIAHRSSLLLAIVMALADTQSLLLFAAVRVHKASADGSLLLLACASLMVVALIGLYRLRVWGVGLNLATNLLVAGLAIGGVLPLPDPVTYALCGTALIQLVLPIPMLVSMAKGRPPRPHTPSLLHKLALPVLVVAMVGACAIRVSLTGC